MTFGGITGAEAMTNLQRVLGYTSADRLGPRPQPPSSWDLIVGIDLEEWMRAGDSDEQIRWLAHLRDHPMPQQGRRPRPPRETCGCCIEAGNAGSKYTSRIPGRDCMHR